MAKRVALSVSLVLALLLGFAGNLTGQFGPQPVYVGIPTAQFNFAAASQQQDEWCWAASTQMILGWYGVPATQAEIVQRVYGSVINRAASDQVISAALNGWGRAANGRVVTISSVVKSGAPPPAILVDQLSRSRPILLTFINGPTSGHAVVITAASYMNTQWGPQIVSLVIRDPYPTSQNVANGGRVEIAGQNLTQFAATMRGYWLVTVQ
jgi:Papain-like cysteine protease AvrRpt2